MTAIEKIERFFKQFERIDLVDRVAHRLREQYEWNQKNLERGVKFHEDRAKIYLDAARRCEDVLTLLVQDLKVTK